jgi:hypothetical protein
MKNPQQVPIKVVEDHLERFGSGLRFDIEGYHYGLKDLAKDDWICYRALVEKADEDRIVMAGNFDHITNNTRKLAHLVDLDIILKEEYEDRGKRIKTIIEGGDGYESGLDLLRDKGYEIVFVGEDLNSGPLFMMDGTHKMIAHYLTHGKGLVSVPCYLCIHPKIRSWSWFPVLRSVPIFKSLGI